MKKKVLSVLIAFVLGAVGVTGIASANSIIPAFIGTDGIGDYFYTFTVDALSTACVACGSGKGSPTTASLTFSNVPGLLSASPTANADWSAATTLTDAVFTFLGPTQTGAFTWPFPFVLTSANITPDFSANLAYTGKDINTASLAVQTNTGFVVGPSAAAPVPEPGTMLLLGTGLVGLGWVARRRQRTHIAQSS